MSRKKEKAADLPSDRLSAVQISASLGESVIGRRIIVLESTRSTNEFLLQALTPELPEGFVVFAEHQTAGRGQRGHRWESAPYRGLWFSILLRPRIPIVESARLTDWAAQSVAATIQRETELKATIKLPNDVYVAGKKVAGVLVETKAGPGSEWTAVAGIGVNVNQMPEEFPDELRGRAGSLAMALGRPIDRPAFAAALLRELERTRTQAFVPTSASQRR